MFRFITIDMEQHNFVALMLTSILLFKPEQAKFNQNFKLNGSLMSFDILFYDEKVLPSFI